MSEGYFTAMELLLADRPSRDDVERAATLLEQASAAGDGQASERCALLDAMGIVRPQDWTRALDFLELAARQGLRVAQEQLLLLRDNEADPAVTVTESPEFWSEVRSGISIDVRIQPGPKTSLSDEPRVRVIKTFATPAECRWLIGLARERVTRATVFDQATGGQKHDPARDNRYLILRLGEMNLVTEVIRTRISAATGLPVPLFEPSQLLHYSVGEKFSEHFDFLDPTNPAYQADLDRFGQRIATFLIYLNEDYAGGETCFPRAGLSYRAQTGDALFFANVLRDGSPDRLTLHEGRPPTVGEKWVFSQWIRDQFPKS